MARQPVSVNWGSSPELNNPAWMGGEILGVRTPPAIDQILSGVGRALATAPERVQGWWNQTDATRPTDKALLGTTLGAAGSGLGDMGLYMVPGAGDAADLGGMAVDMARGDLPISPLTAVLAGTAAMPFVPGAYRWASSHLPARAPTPQAGSRTAQIGALRVGPDPDELFSRTALEMARDPGHKARDKLIYLNPDDFLRLARPFPDGRPSAMKYENIDRVLSRGGPLDDLPALWLRGPHDGDDALSRYVQGHEGRHRASWLKEHGYDSMPVRLVDRNIRWDQQMDPNSFDYLREWPQHLVNETETSAFRFPVPRDDARAVANSRWTQDVPREGPYYPPALAKILSGTDEISSAGPIARQRGATQFLRPGHTAGAGDPFVVDSPPIDMPVFHGARTKGLNEVSPSFGGQATAAPDTRGVAFGTNDDRFAARFTGPDGEVVPVQASLQRPALIDGSQQTFNAQQWGRWFEDLQRQGYDGAVLTNFAGTGGDPADIYASFVPMKRRSP